MLPYKAVLWDIDGTLLDSEPVHERGIIASARTENIVVPHAFVESLVGVGLQGTHARLCTDLGLQMSFADWEAFIEEFYVRNAHDAKPRENVLDIVAWLERCGIKQACVSNSPAPIVGANMKTLVSCFSHTTSPFHFFLSRDDVYEGKPSPEGFLRAARMLGIAPDECVVVEDSLSGMNAGKAAGMTVIAWPQIPSLDTSCACQTVRDLTEFFHHDAMPVLPFADTLVSMETSSAYR